MENIQQMILEQLRTITAETQRIPQILAQLDAISAAQHRLEQRDEEQAQAIAELKSRNHEFVASFTILSGELKQVQRDIDGLKQEVMPLNMAIRTINATSLRVEKLETAALGKDRREQFDATMKELDDWRPLIKGVRWFLLIARGILATAIVTGILWAVGQSGVLGP